MRPNVCWSEVRTAINPVCNRHVCSSADSSCDMLSSTSEGCPTKVLANESYIPTVAPFGNMTLLLGVGIMMIMLSRQEGPWHQLAAGLSGPSHVGITAAPWCANMLPCSGQFATGVIVLCLLQGRQAATRG